MKSRWDRRVALLVLLTAVVCVCGASGQEYPVAAKTLKNGMKILVQTDHSIPNGATSGRGRRGCHTFSST